jgi:hypothetical protein
MHTLKTLLAAGLASSLLGYPLAGAARVDIDVEFAPPPVVVEDAPLRPGYIYAPGYWDWDDSHHRHVWKKGEYVGERRGEHWVPHRWEERNGRYHLNEGHWEHGQ